MATPATILTRRDLNRALLARQLLLSRDARTPEEAIEQVAGLQAQLARPPFIGLWSRLSSFDRADLLRALHARTIVRVTAMRGTLFLLSAPDYRAWRGALQPALTRGVESISGVPLTQLDLPAAEAVARAFLGKQAATFDAIRNHLMPRFPSVNVRHLAYALRMTLPLVQVPDPEASWGYPGAAGFALADRWLKTKVSTTAVSPAALVRRYLAAFGPASVADAQTWSGLQKLGPVFDDIREELVTFRDERKRELFDLPKAPRPASDTPAPVRFVPDWDNVVLGHQDRTRVIADEHRARISTRNLQIAATFLVDGMVAGSWSIARKGRAATLVMEPFVKIAMKDQAALREEAEQVLAFAEPDATGREVTFKA
jgi:Winged helix DNA-binding domain